MAPLTGPLFQYSDYFYRKGIIQQIAGLGAKNLLIDTIREIFIDDLHFPLKLCEFGYVKTPDHTGLPLDSEETTKINVTDIFRYEAAFLPTITVRHTGGSYHPISFNQEGIPGLGGSIRNRQEIVQDGYGNIFTIDLPDKYIFAGAWDLNFEVKVLSESTGDREELIGMLSVGLQHVHRYDLQQAGLFIKSLSFGAESEEEHLNDKFYTQSLNLECYGEWRREYSVGDLIDRIVFFVDVGRIVDGEVSEENNLKIVNMVLDLN